MRKLLPFTLLILFVSCNVGDDDIQLQDQSSITVRTNPAEFANRMIHPMTDVEITYEDVAGRKANDLELTLVSEVLPPVQDSKTMMAVNIDVRNNLIAVAYNYRGDDFLGGVDLINITDDVLTMTAQIEFDAADVNVTYFDGSTLFMGGSAEGPDSTAFLDAIRISSGLPVLERYNRNWLGGHTTTGIVERSNNIYCTTGNSTDNGGGMYIMRGSAMEFQQYLPIADARWVIYERQPIVLTGSSVQYYTTFDESSALEKEFSISNGADAGAKSTLDVGRGFIYVAAGQAGVILLDSETGEHLSTLPLPATSSSEARVNSVIEWSNRMVFSTGDGVYLATVNRRNPTEVPVVIGKLELGDYQSINHVHRVGRYLAIAAGIGGTKYIQIN